MQIFDYNQPFPLESGGFLPDLQIAYHTYGKLNGTGSNVLWVCHALTANSDVADWWEGIYGEGRALDPSKYFIVCANIIGSHYGTTGPLHLNPETGLPWYDKFPLITVRDMVQAHIILRKHLNIERIHTLLGGSLGGQQALEWAIEEPEVIERLIPIATNAVHSPWGIAFNETQRMAILADPTYGSHDAHAAAKGLQAARAIAMLSYRHYHTYQASQTDEHRMAENHRAASYQRYQGEKLTKRFNAYSYVSLSKTMDSHDVGRNRGSIENALATIQAKTLAVGVSSDLLFPVHEQKLLARHIPNATYTEIDSIFGHDGFLTETEKLNNNIRKFIDNVFVRATHASPQREE